MSTSPSADLSEEERAAQISLQRSSGTWLACTVLSRVAVLPSLSSGVVRSCVPTRARRSCFYLCVHVSSDRLATPCRVAKVRDLKHLLLEAKRRCRGTGERERWRGEHRNSGCEKRGVK